MRSRGPIIGALIATALLIAAPEPSTARADSVKEYQVKAVLLYNFASFVTWPDSGRVGTAPPMVVAVLGDDPFGGVLEEVLGKRTVNGRHFAIRRFQRAEDVGRPQILFISSSERGRLVETLRGAAGPGILTVGDCPGFATAGGIIGFVVKNDEISLEINVREAQRARLIFSSKLLRLARLVGD
jgi:hypothetical protein